MNTANIQITLNGADEMASALTWLRGNGFEYLLSSVGGDSMVPPVRIKENDDSPTLQAFYKAFPGARLRVNEGETRESAAFRRLSESPEKARAIGFNLETREFETSQADTDLLEKAAESDAY